MFNELAGFIDAEGIFILFNTQAKNKKIKTKTNKQKNSARWSTELIKPHDRELRAQKPHPRGQVKCLTAS